MLFCKLQMESLESLVGIGMSSILTALLARFADLLFLAITYLTLYVTELATRDSPKPFTSSRPNTLVGAARSYSLAGYIRPEDLPAKPIMEVRSNPR